MHADDSSVSATGHGASLTERLPRTGGSLGTTKPKRRKTAPPPVTVELHALAFSSQRLDFGNYWARKAPSLDQMDRPEEE
jgi:hypothetical protein